MRGAILAGYDSREPLSRSFCCQRTRQAFAAEAAKPPQIKLQSTLKENGCDPRGTERSSRDEHRTLSASNISEGNLACKNDLRLAVENAVEIGKFCGNAWKTCVRRAIGRDFKTLLMPGLGTVRRFAIVVILRLAQKLELNLPGPGRGLLLRIGNEFVQRSS